MLLLKYFTDSVLKAPTLGCICMCLACSLVGVIIFIRKESLLGETLSHATYPGIILSALLSVTVTDPHRFFTHILLGAGAFSIAAIYLLNLCKKYLKMSGDSALCFILTLCFGIGITLASYLQSVNSRIYKQSLIYLFGQAATITDDYLPLYFGLVFFIVLSIVIFYRQIQMVNFDPVFSRGVGIRSHWVRFLCHLFILAAIMIGIRSIGLLLLSGMFIGPAIAARQWTHSLRYMFLISGLFGILSGFFGIFLSVEISDLMQTANSSRPLALATGPMIILVSTFIACVSLLFAPKQGVLVRLIRSLHFKYLCVQENILKIIWHFENKGILYVTSKEIAPYQNISTVYYRLILYYLILRKKIMKKGNFYSLTSSGKSRAQEIVRLHRLWEVYLVHIGVGKERVHYCAEEMEHIITPEMEKRLLEFTKNPAFDPHNNPIPQKIEGAGC